MSLTPLRGIEVAQPLSKDEEAAMDRAWQEINAEDGVTEPQEDDDQAGVRPGPRKPLVQNPGSLSAIQGDSGQIAPPGGIEFAPVLTEEDERILDDVLDQGWAEIEAKKPPSS